MKPVLSMADASGFHNTSPGGAFEATVAPLGAALGLARLGAMLTTVPAGKRAFPFHVHHANDEMFVILEGQGDYRYGAETHPVKAGDVCSAPAAGAAHQLVNTGDSDLKYLSISTMIDPEVVEYPDSGKFATISVGAGNTFTSAKLRYVGRTETSGDYWEGEE